MKIEVQAKNLIKHLKDEDKRIKAIMRRVMKRTIDQGWTETSRQLRAEYYLKNEHIKAGIKKKIDNDNTGRLISSGKPMKFAVDGMTTKTPRWRATQTRKGIRQYIRRGQREMFNHAFIAKMPTGHTGVFERNLEKQQRKVKVYQANKFAYYKWLPIKELTGPSITALFSLRNRVEKIKQFMTDVFTKRFKHEFDRKN